MNCEELKIIDQFDRLCKYARTLIHIPGVLGILKAIQHWQTQFRRRQPVEWPCIKILVRRINYIRKKGTYPPQGMYRLTHCGPRDAFMVK